MVTIFMPNIVFITLNKYHWLPFRWSVGLNKPEIALAVAVITYDSQYDT